MAAHQAPPSLGFSRQEHWSGLPFPSPMHEREMWKWSHSLVSDCSWPHCLQPARLLHPWDFPGKSTGVGCHCLLHPSKTDSDNRSRYFLPIVSSYGLSFLLNIMLWGVLFGIWICNTIAISGSILLRKLLSFLFFLLFSIISFFFHNF